MDKQKKIEELEKDIAVRMAMAKGVAGSMNNGVEGWLAEYLIEKGYRKIPENAVVLMGDELRLYNENIERDREKLKTIRKETAEKFAEMLKARLNIPIDYLDAKDIDEICKEIIGVPTTAELLEKGKKRNEVKLAKDIVGGKV